MALTDRYRHGALVPLNQVLTANESAITGYMVRVDPAGNTAWVGWDIGDVAMLNGTFLNSRATFGLFPLAFGPRGLYVMHADDLANRRLSIYDVASRQWIDYAPILPDPLDPAPNPSVGSNGIAYIDPSGRAVMNYYPEVFERTMPNGERWRIIRETATYIVGGYGPPNDPRYGASLSRLHKPSGKVERWRGNTPIPHDTLETPDRHWTFISGTVNSPEPDAAMWSDDFGEGPVEPPPVSSTPDLDLPTRLTPLPPTWGGCTDGPASLGPRPGTAYWSISDTDDPAKPVSESADYDIGTRPWLDLRWGTESATGGFAALDRCIAKAKTLGNLAVEILCDSPAHREYAAAGAARVHSEGLKPIILAHCVLSASDFRADALAFKALDANGWGIAFNFRGHGKDLVQFQAAILEGMELWSTEHPVCVWFPEWAKAGPKMREWCAHVWSLVPTPVNRPHQASQSMPPVTPPVTPLPPPNADTPVPKHRPARKSLPWGKAK